MQQTNLPPSGQHGKRPRSFPIKALLINDLFDPCFNDEICEAKITDSLKVTQRQMTRLKSPSAKRLISVSIPVNFFFCNFEEHERDQDQVHGFEPLPSEHEDIRSAHFAADSDNEDDIMTSKLPYICCASLMKAFLNN